MLSCHYENSYLSKLFDFYEIPNTAANCHLQTIYLIIPTAYLHLLTECACTFNVCIQYIKGSLDYFKKGYTYTIVILGDKHSLHQKSCDLSFP
jgi:hypothetical protein